MSDYGKIEMICLFTLTILWNGCSDRDSIVPKGGDDRSFVVFSDLQTGYGIYSQLANNISKIEPIPKGAFCCGDIMLRGTNEAEWLSFMNCSRTIMDKIPFYLARGNHEENSESAEEILRQHLYFPLERFNYSFRQENCFFILLDTQEKDEDRAILGNQRNWLFDQLDAATADTSISYIFLFMHQPLYPQGNHKGSNLKNADELHARFLNHKKIRAIFAGHDHLFNKYIKDNLIYITT
jgi:3',5'-cyclic AMP phosphodiesterase CpdA